MAALSVVMDLTVNAFLFLPAMILLTFFTNMPPVPMYAVAKLGDFVKIIGAHFWLKRKKWLKNLTR